MSRARFCAVVTVPGFLLLLVATGCDTASTGSDGGVVHTVVLDGGLPDGGLTSFNTRVTQTNLVADAVSDAGITSADGGTIDPNLVNSWGLARSTTGPWWVSDNGTGLATIYDGMGTPQPPVVTLPPPPTAAAGTKAAPTGVVFNDMGGFDSDVFIFATEDGTIAGWQTGATATLRVDNSASGAVYKGLALAGNTLFVANFNSGLIEKYSNTYAATGTFTDTTLPAGFAPFNIAFLNNKLYVTFAKQDAMKHDDVAGPGNGFIDVFDATGAMQQRLVSNGELNSPWGLALAPSNFGGASNQLLVGNFGAGENFINIYNPVSGAHLGQLLTAAGQPLMIDGLWAIAFGNDVTAGPHNTLFFTAGPDMEMHGLFGKLTLAP
jgi:uncharacterized protein (TIGR03118 family)